MKECSKCYFVVNTYKLHGNYKLQILSNNCLWMREERKEGNETEEEYWRVLKFYVKYLILKIQSKYGKILRFDKSG